MCKSISARKDLERQLLDMDTFSATIQEWQIFYATVAAACATLTGLLFVALALNVDILRQDEHADMMAVARQTFREFLLILMVALLFLVPQRAPFGLTVGLLALGGAFTFTLVMGMWKSVAVHKDHIDAAYFLRGYGLSIVGCLGILVVAIAILFGFMGALYGLVFVLATLLASASRNAWFLLVQAREGVNKGKLSV